MNDSTLARHRTTRGLSSIAAVFAVVFVLALTSVSARAGSAAGREPSGPGSATSGSATQDSRRHRQESVPKKAVIVVGPVGGSTSTYLAKANAIAAAAEAWGMLVVKVYHPNATWARVVAEANGANLFVYLGHGNGWPSPTGPFQEDTKDGLGLNPSEGNTNAYDTKYYGANKIRAEIEFAPNAIVLLNKLCYASGNGEEWMPIPTTDIARQRVDNFASGFLDSGAAVVFALGWQPGENLVNSLFAPTPTTMDGWFQTTFGANRDGTYKPFYGWIGWMPDLYFDSQRVAGARLHLDPDPDKGFLRSVAGNLELTTATWLGNPDPGDPDPGDPDPGDPDPDPGDPDPGDPEPVDTEAPVVSDLTGDQAENTIPASGNATPVFTPNGDELSEQITLRHTLSEGAFLTVEIKRQEGATVRTFTAWSPAGPGSFVWDGRNKAGSIVKDARYDIVVTPKDRAGNVGDAARTSVRVLTAMSSPTLSPALFFPADGDKLAQTSSMGVTLRREASITWRITNSDGDVVRHAMVDEVLPAGSAGWDWDGLDDDAEPVPDGLYTSIVTATTNDGSYSHALPVRVMPFVLKAALKVTAGQMQTITLLTAEPVKGGMRIEVKQRGLDAYTLHPTKLSPTRFTARWTAKSGSAGRITITVTATDVDGGIQVREYTARLR